MPRDDQKWKRMTGWSALEGRWLHRRHMHPELLAQIAERIRQGELRHSGELMLAVEAVSPSHEPDSRLRALEVFGRLGVWDTPHNTGVLLYLALDRRRIELVPDRGVTAPQEAWNEICGRLESRLRKGHYGPGLLAAVDEIEELLSRHCPEVPAHANTDDLPNVPVML